MVLVVCSRYRKSRMIEQTEEEGGSVAVISLALGA